MALAVALAERVASLRNLPLPDWTGGPDTLPAAAVTAVSQALDRGETHYTDRPGIPALRKAVAGMLETRFGFACNSKSDVVITCGATEARFVCLQELVAPGDLVFAPALAERVAGAATVRGVTLTDDAAAATLAYLAASTGEAAVRAALARLGPETVVVFEADAEGGFHPAKVGDFVGRTVTIGYLGLADGLASARIGYLAAPTVRAAALRDFKQALTICSTNLSQWAALAVMETP